RDALYKALRSGRHDDWETVRSIVKLRAPVSWFEGDGFPEEDTSDIVGLDHLIDGVTQPDGAVEQGFAALDMQIQTRLHPRQVLVTEYPDPAMDFDNSGNRMPIMQDIVQSPYQLEIDQPEEEWATENFLNPLNETIETFSRSAGWNYVSGVSKAFIGHGYSAD